MKIKTLEAALAKLGAVRVPLTRDAEQTGVGSQRRVWSLGTNQVRYYAYESTGNVDLMSAPEVTHRMCPVSSIGPRIHKRSYMAWTIGSILRLLAGYRMILAPSERMVRVDFTIDHRVRITMNVSLDGIWQARGVRDPVLLALIRDEMSPYVFLDWLQEYLGLSL